METLQINDDDQTDDDNLYTFDSFNTLRAIGFSVNGKNRENYSSNF